MLASVCSGMGQYSITCLLIQLWLTLNVLLTRYMNITIGLVVPMIGYLYYANEGNAVPTVPADVIKGGLAVMSFTQSPMVYCPNC